MHRAALVVTVLVAALVLAAPALAGSGYLRYPDIHGSRLVVAAEGDLWTCPDGGGRATRLTSAAGGEYFPRFSPDGARIAFTGEYDGNRDVFVIPSAGGEPQRLTWAPGADEVIGWTPDGTSVIFRSRMENPLAWELFTVPANGGDAVKLPLGWASRLAIDPATGMWAFTRTSIETATWKRYRGGEAPGIWVGDPARADFTQVTSFSGANVFPMWHGGRIYFLSDQGGTANLWSMTPDGADRRQETAGSEWDARWPAMAPDGRIAFVLGGDVHVFDPATRQVKKVEIDVPSERTLTRVRYADAEKTLSFFALAPKADRLAVVTRGEIFSVPVKEGVTLPVTRGSGARESFASFSPDGKSLLYVSDESGEEEIRAIDAWGRGAAKVVQGAGASGWHFPPAWSPDGASIAWADQTHVLWVAPAAGGAAKQVDRAEAGEIRDYAWSPDGRWLAYVKPRATDYNGVWIYDTKSGKSVTISTPTTSDYAPAWDPDGRYLYFLSDRATNPTLDSRDLAVIEARNTVVYAALLRRDVKDPFANLAGLPPDEKAAKDEATKKEDKKDEKKAAKGKAEDAKKDEEEKPKPVEIDLDGLADRVVKLPIERGNYAGLGATAKTVFYLSFPVLGMGDYAGIFDDGAPQATLMAFDLEKKKADTFMDGVSTYALAAKEDKLAVMKKRGEIVVVPAAAAPKDLSDARVSLADVVVELDPREEWKQIYYEAWRQNRDFFWDPKLGGLDWVKIRDQYASLLPRLASRDELRDLLGELIGELNNSHTYVIGGDPGVKAPSVSSGTLGADVVREGGAFRVTRVLRGDPADMVRSPLDEPGVNVKEGEYILAVNHRPVPAGAPLLAAFAGRAGKEVVLTVNAKPVPDGARDVVVTLLGDEGDLRYVDWVRRNREAVTAKTGGAIGYIHLPDMGSEGMTRFSTWFYPQLDKQGMIVDCRWNGGGFVSQMILERFRRHVLSFDMQRYGGVNTYPYRTLNGPFVVLTNEFAGSDGDIFPAAVQLEGLAPVIGMRSWGGVVGIRADKRLQDGGIVTLPEFAWWDPRWGWGLENRGVVPDIELQNLPQDLARGVDAQLDRAIAEVTTLAAARPQVKPAPGPVRQRSRAAFAGELP